MKIGLALSGGGIRGVAHAGVIKALEEKGINIDIIGGTSSGSLVATLYAMGYKPNYIYLLFKRYAKEMVGMDFMPLFNGMGKFIKNKKFQIVGFNNGQNIEREYNMLALNKGIKNISDIKMPIVITAVDINVAKEYIFTNYIPKDTKEANYITDIPIGLAVRASSSFPGIFCPCKYKKHHFLDGGILDNVPVSEIKKQGADIVIAVNFKSDEVDDNSNIVDITMRTLDIMGTKISEKNLKKYSDYIITIETNKIGLLDCNKIEECYISGYNFGKRAVKDIDRIIKNNIQ